MILIKPVTYPERLHSLLSSQLRQSIATKIPRTHHPLPRPHKDRGGMGFLAACVWSFPAFEGFMRCQRRTSRASPVISTKEEGTILIKRAILLARGQLGFWMKEPPNWSIIPPATLKRLEKPHIHMYKQGVNYVGWLNSPKHLMPKYLGKKNNTPSSKWA